MTASSRPVTSATRRSVLLAFASAKPDAYVDEPWRDAVVCKVVGKMFVIFSGDDSPSMSVSCGPGAVEWRARYPSSVTVARYVGRYGWNSVLLDGHVPLEELRELIDASYARVVAKLPKSKQPSSSR